MPMIGREEELGQSSLDVRRSGARSCGLFTVIISGGVGKSRLAHGSLNSVDPQVVHGRCLSYGGE